MTTGTFATEYVADHNAVVWLRDFAYAENKAEGRLFVRLDDEDRWESLIEAAQQSTRYDRVVSDMTSAKEAGHVFFLWRYET